MKNITLEITIKNTELPPFNGTMGATTYSRQFPSIEEFLAEFKEPYDLLYGADGWAVIEKQ